MDNEPDCLAIGEVNQQALFKRVAAVVTEYRTNSHADVIVGRLLEGYEYNGRHQTPQVEVVSMYTDQVPSNDMSRAMAANTLTAENFESTILENDIVLVDFWASWCGPCRQFAPIYEDASERHQDVFFGSVDTESEQALAAAAQITSIPTLMAFKDGVLVFRQPGALPAEALEQLLTAVRELDVEQAQTQHDEEN